MTKRRQSVLAATSSDVAGKHRQGLIEQYRAVRGQTERICQPLPIEDYVVQAVVDASPPKWVLGHVTWFFETFVLREWLAGYVWFDRDYPYLFNSYYVQAGPRHCRGRRGLVGRPTVERVLAYRHAIDECVCELIASIDETRYAAMHDRILLGLQHEQQHQELLLTDIKYNLFMNPTLPAYRDDLRSGDESRAVNVMGDQRWSTFQGGLVEIGAAEDGSFAWDNERQRHPCFLQPFALQRRTVTNRQYLAFVEEGGYRDARFWLSDGWAAAQEGAWEAPLYWLKEGSRWHAFTLGGVRELDEDEPVCHISHYEADAYARWAGKRLPTEFEWEHAAATSQACTSSGHFVQDDRLHPMAVQTRTGQAFDANRGTCAMPLQMLGNVWEWTASAYLPYPRFRPQTGPLGEYNGKFMASQMVLRGGSCATPREHARITYRNFFHPHLRWQFGGIRLADDVT